MDILDAAATWSAIGQVGAFVVAIPALIISIITYRGSKAVGQQAERSAVAAETSAKAAERTADEAVRANQRAAAENYVRAALVRGELHPGPPTAERREGSTTLMVSVTNVSSWPALNVSMRYLGFHDHFTDLEPLVRSGETARSLIDIPTRLAASDYLPSKLELRYDMGGVTWLRSGLDNPRQVDGLAREHR